MSHFRRIALGLTLLSIWAAHAFAAPFDPATVSADARWMIHVDMDRLRDGALWKTIDAHLKTNDQVQSQINEVAAFSGMHFPQDLHDFTIYGKQSGDDANIVLIHANFDRPGTLGALQMNPDFASQPFQGHDVLSWSDKGKTNYGAFYDDSTAIIGHSSEQVQLALGTLDDKSKGVKSTDTVALGVNDQQVAYVGVRDFPALQKPDASPFLRRIDSGWVGLVEGNDGLHLQAALGTRDEASAGQLNTSINGLIAIVGMMSGSPSTDPRITMLNDALKTCTLKASGNHVQINWPITESQVSQAIDMFFLAHQKAGDAGDK